ncbi:hypothetical protein [Saccharopolyspora elongata]|uniref:hypothetical protein n=1 Tax=Saccharopolyspora elongata TaxID=2530387 RepID=UPI0014051543|nr:hypothetical protein [Saccharopolyspora elongata]
MGAPTRATTTGAPETAPTCSRGPHHREAVTAALGEDNVDQAEAIVAELAQCLARRRRSPRILGRL